MHRQRRCCVPRLRRLLPDACQCALRASRICSSCMVCSSAAGLCCNSWDETWTAGVHHVVESLSGLYVTDLVKRILRKGGDVQVLSRAVRRPGRGEQSRAALHRPGQEHLRRGLSSSCSDCQNHRIFEWARSHPHDPKARRPKELCSLLAELQKLGLRKIWMRFDLDHGRLILADS